MVEKQKVKQEPSADATLSPSTKSGPMAGTEHAMAAEPGCSPACSASCTVHLETTGTDACLKQPGVSQSHQAIFDAMKPFLLAGRPRGRRGDWKKKDCDCPVPEMIVTEPQALACV